LRFCPDERFNAAACTACGTCYEACPVLAVDRSENGVPERFRSNCIGCGHCGAYCPSNCFSLDSPVEEACNSDIFTGLLAGRRSCRFFRSDQPISGEDLGKLLSVTGYSPTGKNAGGLLVRAFNGSEAVEGLLMHVRKFFRIACRTGVPQLVARMSGYADVLQRLRSGEDLLFRGAPTVLFFHVPAGNATWRTDGIIAATLVMTHAGTLGISTLWNGFAEAFYPLMSGWHAPQSRGTRLAAVLCAGYPSRMPLWKLPARDFYTVVEGKK
jgi:nitroreductase/NAD-dependent dihydropyrimidine dehydrogenase PreA subunit